MPVVRIDNAVVELVAMLNLERVEAGKSAVLNVAFEPPPPYDGYGVTKP